MPEKRILIFSATFGNGHIRAAEALIQVFQEKMPEAKIVHLDFGRFINKSLNTIVKNTYAEIIKYTPKLWREFYYRTSKINPDSLFQKILNGLGKKEYVKFINSFQPDLIICTYPTVAGVLAKLREEYLRIPIVTVITDYAVHSQWMHKGVDLYIVGSEKVRSGLVQWGIDESKVHVTGIPVHPAFEREVDLDDVRARLGLKADLPTCLILGGAYRMAEGVKDLCMVLAELSHPVQTIVVCGHDEKLHRFLTNITGKNPIIPLGYVHNIDELMSVADLMVSKAGGLTVSEAMTKGLPMLIYKPIPGQEEENCAFIEKTGAGIVVKKEEELSNSLIYLLTHPELLKKMGEAGKRAIPHQSAEKAVNLMLQLMESND